MNIRLEVHKSDRKIFEGAFAVSDAQSFGHACADVWRQLEAEKFKQATSIGALMDTLGENVLEVLDGAVITVSRA
jgi:hypothetical protein